MKPHNSEYYKFYEVGFTKSRALEKFESRVNIHIFEIVCSLSGQLWIG